MYWTISFFVLYLLLFPLKALRDYIMEYQAGHPYRWDNSVFSRLPKKIKVYLLGMNRNRMGNIDGWHQADGYIMLVPLLYILALLSQWVWHFGLLKWVALSIIAFIVGYQYFNFTPSLK